MNYGFTMVVARHAQTDSNARGLWVGRGDDRLNEAGIEQSRVFARSISNIKFDMIVSSDMLRSIQTAQIISESLRIPVIMRTPLIRDRDYGKLEGLTSDQIMREYGVKMNSLSPEIEEFANAEPVQAVMGRAMKFMELYSQLFSGKSVVVITHGAFIRAIYELFVGKSDGIRFTNCASFMLESKGEEMRVVRGVTYIGNQ
ncbi:MAG: histidine phosphatase family protein [Thermoplasmata archaeon]